MNNNTYIAYTDGAANNKHPKRPGGSAYIILNEKGDELKRSSKGFIGTTNNRMELLAIVSVVNSLPENSKVTIHTDSKYCMVTLKSYKPKKNLKLIDLYHKIVSEKNLSVIFQWVKGHSGNNYNEECDSLAKREYYRMLA